MTLSSLGHNLHILLSMQIIIVEIDPFFDCITFGIAMFFAAKEYIGCGTLSLKSNSKHEQILCLLISHMIIHRFIRYILFDKFIVLVMFKSYITVLATIEYTDVSKASVSTNFNLTGFDHFTIILIFHKEPLCRHTKDIINSTAMF